MENMTDATLAVPFAFAMWLPLVFVLFIIYPPRRAAFAALLIGWLLLPMAQYKIPKLPPLDKANLIGAGIVLGIIVFDGRRLLALRPRWYDLPIAAACMAPLASSLYNGLGAYDGISAMTGKALVWGAPYLIGRLYCADLEGAREAAIALFVAGVAYVPLCLYEIRFSPQLHAFVYGYHQHEFIQAMRYGGYRPMVFMEHGLMVGLFMTSACLAGLWLWRSQALERLGPVPMIALIVPLLGTTVLLKSVSAIVLLLVGIAVLGTVRLSRSYAPLAILILVPLVYVVSRALAGWDGQQLVDLSKVFAGPERAASLQFRADNENVLVTHALEHRLFGWGGWSTGFNVKDRDGHYRTTDSLWIILLSREGLVGLGAALATFLLPAILLIFRVPASASTHPAAAAPLLLAAILTLWMTDCLFNAMVGPAYPMLAGGLAGFPHIVMRRKEEK